jgi:hypothetical protein
VDVPYSPDVLTYVPDSPTHSVQIRFYRTALIKAHVREPFFVLRIGEHSALFEPVDSFINSPDPGPKYTEKVSFNGHDAAFAPGKRMFYEIPYASARNVAPSKFAMHLKPPHTLYRLRCKARFVGK